LDRGTRRPGDQPRWLTSATSASTSVHGSDRVDRVKTADVRVERGSGGLGGRPVEDGGDMCRVAGDAYGVRYSRAVWWFGSQNHRWPVSRVWASKPGRRFREGTDGTWQHRGVCVEAKLSHEGCGGRRMKITSGWTITPSG
jgi:hypothetical protein